MRKWIEQLDLERLVKECIAATRSDEPTVRDAILDVLNAMWLKQDAYKDKFQTLYGLYSYTKVATIRRLIAVRRQSQKYQPLEHVTLPDGKQTPEDQVIAMLADQDCTQWLAQAKASLVPKEAHAMQELYNRVLQSPEIYIRKRESGDETGRFVFSYSRLANDLKWPRRKVYERLASLRKALLSQHKKQYGENV